MRKKGTFDRLGSPTVLHWPKKRFIPCWILLSHLEQEICMIHVSTTEHVKKKKKDRIDVHVKEIEDSPRRCPTVTYRPLTDCQNIGQTSWLNLRNSGLQTPAPVSSVQAWTKTSPYWEILSWAVEGSQVRLSWLCLWPSCVVCEDRKSVV